MNQSERFTLVTSEPTLSLKLHYAMIMAQRWAEYAIQTKAIAPKDYYALLPSVTVSPELTEWDIFELAYSILYDSVLITLCFAVIYLLIKSN